MPKERPIIFGAPMIRAILRGEKTQTRRIIKVPGIPNEQIIKMVQFRDRDGKPTGEWGVCTHDRVISKHIRCPYGAPGDRLWVREALLVTSMGFDYAADGAECLDLADANEDQIDLWDRRCHEEGPDLHPTKIPSIHMPRWASRILLEVTDVRVERLQDISEADARAEGAPWAPSVITGNHPKPIVSFERLWESIHGPDSWAENPWLWVIEFRRIEAPNA